MIGHEFVGRIVEIGPGVTGYELGDRVSAEGHIVCGHCRNCRAGRQHLCPNTVGIGVNRNGAFAEYIVMPASNLWPIPDQIPSELAAFFDPYGNAAHCALEFDVIGEDVLITGAGPIGIIAAGICKHIGARNVVVTDVNDYRLKLAADMGATRVVNVSKQTLEGRDGRPAHGRLRRRPGDERQPDAPSTTCSTACTTAARSPCSASCPRAPASTGTRSSSRA